MTGVYGACSQDREFCKIWLTEMQYPVASRDILYTKLKRVKMHSKLKEEATAPSLPHPKYVSTASVPAPYVISKKMYEHFSYMGLRCFVKSAKLISCRYIF